MCHISYPAQPVSARSFRRQARSVCCRFGHQECAVSNIEKTSVRIANRLRLRRPNIDVSRDKARLFVDTEAGIRHTLLHILRRYGFTVTIAATVCDAITRNEMVRVCC